MAGALSVKTNVPRSLLALIVMVPVSVAVIALDFTTTVNDCAPPTVVFTTPVEVPLILATVAVI